MSDFVDRLFLALFGSLAIVVSAGCGGSQPPSGAPGALPQTPVIAKHPDAPEYEVSSPLLYVVNFTTTRGVGNVVIYDPKINNPSPIAIITDGVDQPNGDCIDSQGTLYVVNSQNSISEYALGKTKPSKIITEGLYSPGFCAIDSRGSLWVTNGDNIRKYRKGSTEPDGVIEEGLTDAVGIAIDHAGNIYVGNLEPYGTSNIQVYPPGAKSPSRTITDGITWPVGIAVDPAGTLYVTNDVQCNIEEYLPGKNDPYRTITKDIDGPTAVTFTKSGWMYEVNGGIQGCTSKGPWPVILEFRPGSAKPTRREIKSNLHTPVGIAHYPPLLP